MSDSDPDAQDHLPAEPDHHNHETPQRLGRSRSTPVLLQEKQIIVTSRKSQDELRRGKVNRFSKHKIPEGLGPNDAHEIHAPHPRRSRSLEHVRTDAEYYEHREPDHGLTPHALYKESLYTGLHALGRPTERYICGSEDICMYSHVAFPVAPNEQKAVAEHVVGEPFPLTIINARVRKAEGLPTRDHHGDVNPYCLVGLETEESASGQNWEQITFAPPNSNAAAGKHHKRIKQPEKRLDQNYSELPFFVKTSIQYQTTSPVWDEKFQCVALRPSVDKFSVEVWDHNDEKSTLQALKHAKDAKKANIVKGGMEHLEEAYYRGKRDNFLGKVGVRIDDVPCDGAEVWYNLKGVTHRGVAARGRVLLQIWLTHAFRHGRHYEEYEEPRLTLSCLWDYVLNLESKRYEGASNWDGKIPPAAKCLLFQYALQTGISEATQGLIRWKAYLKHNLGLDGVAASVANLRSTCAHASDEKIQDWKVSELETALLEIIIERVCPILRNHLLGETQERVHFAIEIIQSSVAILKRLGCPEAVHRVNVLVTTYIRLCVLDWYEVKFHEIVAAPLHDAEARGVRYYEVADAYAQMMRRVNGVLHEGLSIWSLMFWMEGFIDYMPLMYGELQKMVVFDVEDACWVLTWRIYSTNDQQRLTLLRLNQTDTKFCTYLFQLYHETQLFVLRANEIMALDDKKTHLLDDYHRWFRPVFCLWLGFAFIKSCQMITKSIMVDNVVAEDEYVKTSSSALDTRVVFSQLATFWTELNWPDVTENYVIIHFLMEVLAHVAILYAKLKYEKIEREGYFDTIDRFDVSDRLCIALNNIETVKTALINCFHTFKLDDMMNELEHKIGVHEAAQHQAHLQDLMLAATDGIDERVGHILEGVRARIKPEIRENIEDYLIHLSRDPSKGNDANEGLLKLVSYLEDNFVVLQKRLVENIFVPVLQVFWKAFCEELVETVRHFPLNETMLAQKNFFHQIEYMVKDLMDYFRGNGAGLNEHEIYCDEYVRLEQFITLFQWNTTSLIGLYFEEKAKEQFFPHPPKYGTLQARASFWNGALNVEVISGKDLVGSDPVVSNYWPFCKGKSAAKATSDCMIQMDLVPETLFAHPKKQETTIKWNTTNPVYNESFTWTVDVDECRHAHAVLRFTAKDFDLLSKNDFLGEAFVSLQGLPGVKDHATISQPMTLFLRSKDDNNTAGTIMQILKCRSWENLARQFVTDEEGRVVKIKETSK